MQQKNETPKKETLLEKLRRASASTGSLASPDSASENTPGSHLDANSNNMAKDIDKILQPRIRALNPEASMPLFDLDNDKLPPLDEPILEESHNPAHTGKCPTLKMAPPDQPVYSSSPIIFFCTVNRTSTELLTAPTDTHTDLQQSADGKIQIKHPTLLRNGRRGF